jgi:probable phosphoglycerate mutase
MRHGQTGSNLVGALDTAAPGAVLTELGLRQAEAAVPHLVRRGVAAAYSSHLTRARQTVAALAAHLGTEPRVHHGFAEIAAGELEMRTDPDSVRGYAHTVLTWLGGDLDLRMPGGESGHEFLARYDEAVEHVADQARQQGHRAAVVVSHGAAIGTWVARRALNLDAWAEAGRLRNTGMVALDRTAAGWAVAEWVPHPLAGPEYDAPDPYSPTAGRVT